MTIEKKTSISIIIFLSLIILINAFVIYPLFQQINNDTQWLVFEKDRFLTLDEKIDNLRNFEVPQKEREEALKQIEDLFIDSEVPVDFISFLEKTGKQCSIDVEISPFSVGRNNKDSWPFLNFQVTVSGPFPSFLMFLEKIENSPYLIEIQNLTISQLAGTKQSSGNIKALLSFKVFSK